MKYRVEHRKDNTYQVILDEEYGNVDTYMMPIVFQGSLSDCESYIRLKLNENIDF